MGAYWQGSGITQKQLTLESQFNTLDWETAPWSSLPSLQALSPLLLIIFYFTYIYTTASELSKILINPGSKTKNKTVINTWWVCLPKMSPFLSKGIINYLILSIFWKDVTRIKGVGGGAVEGQKASPLTFVVWTKGVVFRIATFFPSRVKHLFQEGKEGPRVSEDKQNILLGEQSWNNFWGLHRLCKQI